MKLSMVFVLLIVGLILASGCNTQNFYKSAKTPTGEISKFIPCVAKYLDETRCSKNDVEIKYRYSDCSTAWVKWYTCSYSCKNGRCIFPTSVNEIYEPFPKTNDSLENDNYGKEISGCMEGYICEDSFMRAHRKADCSITDYVYCEYGCGNGKCIEQSETNGWVVSSVIDGDTLILNRDERIRLIGINAPESNENYYIEAKNKLKGLVEGKLVRLEEDVSDKDLYGRLLRYVYVEELFVNYEMVRLGYATAYEYLPDTKYSNILNEAEREAKEKGLGIWKVSDKEGCIVLLDFHYDAEGDDNYNLNDESVTLENKCSYTIDMNQWTIKDEATHIYTFGDFSLDGSARFTFYTGSGKDTNKELYWNKRSAVWNNNGDTLYLRDFNGDLVLEYSY